MSRIMFTDGERKLLNLVSVRQGAIIRKLAALIGSRSLKKGTGHVIDLEEFLGRGCGSADCRRMAAELSAMPDIVRRADFTRSDLVLHLGPEALPLLRKLAIQSREKWLKDGDGVKFCEAALSLKRALGWRGDVWFADHHDVEVFDFGEDISYMACAFESDRWRMSIYHGTISDHASEIEIRPEDAGRERSDRIEIVLMRRGDAEDEQLAVVPMAEFADPAAWERRIPAIAEAVRTKGRRDLGPLDFTDAELDMLVELDGRRGHGIREIAGHLGAGALEGAEHAVDLADILNLGYGQDDRDRLAAALAALPGIVERAEVGDTRLHISFRPEALPFLRKLAVQEELADLATRDMRDHGETDVVCPRCGGKVDGSYDSRRLHLSCPCRFIRNGEIYL